jgi:preprotein translocase subunit SecE
MSTEVSNEASSPLDTVKLALSFAMLAGGIYGFYYFEAQPTYVRLLGLLAVVAAAVFVAVQTNKGRAIWRFSTDARTEVRKVVWPTRQETLQTLLIIGIAVLLTAIFLWAVDSLLFMLVRYATGQG